MKPTSQQNNASRLKLNKITIQKLSTELQALRAGQAVTTMSDAPTVFVCPTCNSCVTIQTCITCQRCPEEDLTA